MQVKFYVSKLSCPAQTEGWQSSEQNQDSMSKEEVKMTTWYGPK